MKELREFDMSNCGLITAHGLVALQDRFECLYCDEHGDSEGMLFIDGEGFIGPNHLLLPYFVFSFSSSSSSSSYSTSSAYFSSS